jgi:hypothetical protein
MVTSFAEPRLAHEVQMTLEEIERSLYEHDGWFERVQRAAHGGVPLGSRDLAEDAHRNCVFGRWLYGDSHLQLDTSLAIAPLEEEHIRLHGLARQLLRDVAMRRPVVPMDVHRLNGSLAQLREKTYLAKSVLWDMLWLPARRKSASANSHQGARAIA